MWHGMTYFICHSVWWRRVVTTCERHINHFLSQNVQGYQYIRMCFTYWHTPSFTLYFTQVHRNDEPDRREKKDLMLCMCV
jgi:hypothetical protein